jgi:lipoyl(octanoyl) transferase
VPGVHVHWGLAPYGEVHALQQRLVARIAEGTSPNVLLTGEHPPVITLGRRTPPEKPYPSGIPVVVIERGGEATYHGPGQLVAYPLVHLAKTRSDLHRFQRDLEEVGIRTLADFGVAAGRKEGLTGVWVGERKIQSLGIAVRRWVTWHGLALNVTTDLAPFRAFDPCGLSGAVMTSMREVLGRDVTVAEVVPRLVRHASEVLPGGPFVAGELEGEPSVA